MKWPFPDIQKILCIGSHADDIEIGCGGTMLKILAATKSISVYWVILSADGQRAKESLRSAEVFLADAQDKKIVTLDFQDAFFPYCSPKLKTYFYQLRSEFEPDLIFTHHLQDRHQDHRLVSELTWNTFRDHLIFEYEIPKYEGDLGKPNVFVSLPESTCRHKISTIIDSFESQQSRSWFSADIFWALLRIRGLESKSPGNFAEALHCRKMVI